MCANATVTTLYFSVVVKQSNFINFFIIFGAGWNTLATYNALQCGGCSQQAPPPVLRRNYTLVVCWRLAIHTHVHHALETTTKWHLIRTGLLS